MVRRTKICRLHAVLDGVVGKKLQWLQERGVSPKDPDDVKRGLPRLIEYFRKENITGIQLDELKAMWRANNEEAAEEIKALVEGGADINARDEDGCTVLHYAARAGNTELISLLLDRGADMTAVDYDGTTVLHYAAASGHTEVVSLLLDRGADMTAVDNDGWTVLHHAAESGHTGVVSLLLDRGANVNALDKEHCNPLGIVISGMFASLDKAVATARLLCSNGSNPRLLDSINTLTLQEDQKGLLESSLHWLSLPKDEKPTDIPIEVIEGGKNAVRTFLRDLKKTSADELVYRCKVCVVGPSTWGKTSLVKSMVSKASVLMDVKDRTIGIDLVSLPFEEHNNEGAESKVKHHNVTFWDFAGQDVYQVTHALFYSERTLYLICVDLSKYAEKLKEVDEYSRSEKTASLQRFFEENVLRWVRLILFRQPSAQFKVIGTKQDLVPEDQLKGISKQMNLSMKGFVDTLNMETVTDDVKHALDATFKPKNLVTATAKQVVSIEEARESIEGAIIKNSKKLSFRMTVTYSKVFDWIFKTKQSCKDAAPQDRVKQLIVPFNDLFEGLNFWDDTSQCEEILRALHRLGDVLWYEDKAANPDNLVILDPKIMLELVREVVNHTYERQKDESYNALYRDGTLHHSLLMTFSWWKALKEVDDQLVYLFKHLLMHFNLAYPASTVVELATADMIVPTYWKTKAAATRDLAKSLSKQQSSAVAGEAIAKWQYSIPVDISEAVYVNFVVQSYRQDAVRKIGSAHLTCSALGKFFAVINFVADKKKLCDNITIEVAAATKEIAWAEMRDFVMAMEIVLGKFKGLATAKQTEFERFVIDSNNNLHVVSGLMKYTRVMDQLYSENPWLPPDFEWFIESAWKHPGKLDELQARKVTLQLNHRLDVLKQLVASSGECHHGPLEIKAPNDFLTRYTDFLQVGASILSLASSAIPIEIAKTAVEMVLEACQTRLDSAQAVGLILARAGLIPGEVKSSTALDMPSRKSFLCELLKILDKQLDEFNISEVSKLCCVADSEGRFVWVHEKELEGLQHGFTLRDPPKPSVTPQIKSTSFSLSVTQLVCAGCKMSLKDIYCEWKVVHGSREVARGNVEVAADSGTDIIKFSPNSVELNDVSSDIMLSECIVEIYVMQSSSKWSCCGDKIIADGEEKLEAHTNDRGPMLITVTVTGKDIPKSSAATCEFSIVSATSNGG